MNTTKGKLIKASGRISVDQKRGRVALEVGGGILDYYSWLVTREYWIKMGKPLHSGHITIGNPNFHKKIDWKYANSIKGKRVSFYYDPVLVRGGQTKGFLMFYLSVYSVDIEMIKKRLGIVELPSYYGMHLTICTGKGVAVPWWPSMIKIR